MSKISLIIAVYNAEEFLRECLDSVVNQTLKDIEIICVDDGSVDKSAQILEEYAKKDTRIKIITQKNSGLSMARNNAMKITKGQYIQFLDADDWINNNTCEILYNLANDNNLDMLQYSGVNFFNENYIEQESKYWNFLYLPPKFRYKSFTLKDAYPFMHKMAVSSCLTIYKRKMIDDNKLEFPPHLCYEDNLFFIKSLFSAKKIGITKEKLYHRRLHSAQITQNYDKHYLDYIKITDLVLSFLKEQNISYILYNKYKKGYLKSCISIYDNFNTLLQNKYKEEYYTLLKKYKYNPKYRMLKQIFSIENNHSKTHKIITILGIKIKLKRRK